MSPVAAPLGTAEPVAASPRTRTLDLAAVATVLGAYVLSRFALVAAALVIAARHHAGVASILSPWDGGYYLGIAEGGYPSHVTIAPYVGSTVAFFPLFPLLGRGLEAVTGLPIGWAMPAVTWVAGAASALAAVALVAPRYGPRRGLQAGVLLAVFPGSVVDGIVYADGVAVAFAAAALLAGQRRRYLLAGLLGAAATASLSLMVLPLVLALAAGALAARSWRGLAAPVLAACGGGAFLCYLWAHTGSIWTWSRVEHAGWMVHLSLPWSGVTAFDSYAFSATGTTVLTALSIAVAAGGLVALIVLRAPLEWVVFSAVVIAGVTFDGGAWIAPRFVFDAFPLVLALGVALPRRALWPVAAVSTVALALLLAAYSPINRVFLNV